MVFRDVEEELSNIVSFQRVNPFTGKKLDKRTVFLGPKSRKMRNTLVDHLILDESGLITAKMDMGPNGFIGIINMDLVSLKQFGESKVISIPIIGLHEAMADVKRKEYI